MKSAELSNVPKKPKAFRGDRLKELRELKKMNQEEFERYLGISPGQISRYENGIIEPTAGQLAEIAKRLDISTDYLLGLTDYVEGKPVMYPQTPDEIELIKAKRDGRFYDAMQQLLDEVRDETKKRPKEGS